MTITDSKTELNPSLKINSFMSREPVYVFFLTAFMMIIEILAGYLTGSLDLLAEGWPADG